MAVRLYVGNLPFKATEEQLQGLFQQAGTVQEVSIMRDRMSGQSRGFGFIEMPKKEEAEKAISMLNGKDMKGRTATVNEAKPRTDSPRSGGFGANRRF